MIITTKIQISTHLTNDWCRFFSSFLLIVPSWHRWKTRWSDIATRFVQVGKFSAWKSGYWWFKSSFISSERWQRWWTPYPFPSISVYYIKFKWSTYLWGWSLMLFGLKRFIVGLYGGTADEHLDEPLLILCVAFNLLSLRNINKFR